MSRATRSNLRRRVQRTGLATLGLLLAMTSAAVAVPGVTPAAVEKSLDPGGSAVIAKSVETPEIPPEPDIVLMADTTGSMGAAISNVKSNAASIMNQVQASSPAAQFAVAEYRDVGYNPVFALNQGLTSDTGLASTAINTWNAGGGGDFPEAWINALVQISGLTYRPDSTRVLVMFGDAPSHDPSNGFTEAQATAALTAAGIRVIAINVGNLDSSGQATRITDATSGVLTSAGPGDVAAAILAELQNLPALVEPSTVCDDPSVSLTFSPSSSEVTSGDTATFDETINVGAGAPQGGTVVCTTDFLVNGVSAGPGFVETTTVHVNDITPPVVTVESKVVEATGPDGAVVAYDSSAEDNVDGPLTPICAPLVGVALRARGHADPLRGHRLVRPDRGGGRHYRGRRHHASRVVVRGVDQPRWQHSAVGEEPAVGPEPGRVLRTRGGRHRRRVAAGLPQGHGERTRLWSLREWPADQVHPGRLRPQGEGDARWDPAPEGHGRRRDLRDRL